MMGGREHVVVQLAEDRFQPVVSAEQHGGLVEAAHIAERRVYEPIQLEAVPSASVGLDLLANDAEPSHLLWREPRVIQEPCLETDAKLAGTGHRRIGPDFISVGIDRDPGARGRIDVVVNVDHEQRAGLRRLRTWGLVDDETTFPTALLVP